ncbi:hypothetical protein [Alkalibacillus aidingensis]|uniref:hypothetical protein n=1 Tax=Alkalibacillus aidingensis TaxID=2747607 RepID=UPI00166012F4|nr:hypothetical protein [Alkalibacillus aidingensis]
MRAKKEIEKEYTVPFTFEIYGDEINDIVLSAIRKIKTDHRIKKTNNYFFVSVRNGLEDIANESLRKDNLSNNSVYYNWLNEEDKK